MLKLTEDSLRLLSDQMCTDLDDLRSKIESTEIDEHSLIVCEAIETLCGFVGQKTADDVNEYCYAQIGNKEGEPDFVLDAIRMAFYRFISGGLKDLYVFQENDAWFPKIILTQVLCPYDIDSLDEEFIIYRGCNVAELESMTFG